MDLESALRLASYKVWQELEPVHKGGVNLFSVREEALTTMSLKEIANANCSKIPRIMMIPPNEEKVKGYDFEICIGSAKKRKFVRFFIQAKKLSGTHLQSSYSTFDIKQNDALENYSTLHHSIPLYALYNHLEESDRDLIHYYNSNSLFDKKALGITITTSTKLKIERKKKFKDIHKSSVPAYFRLPFFRYHPLNKEFYEDAVQAGVPLHELAYFTIEKAQEYNKRYRELKRKNKLPFFFFFASQDFLDDGDELIPILNKGVGELEEDFLIRREEQIKSDEHFFKSKALLIINQDQE